MYALFFLVMNNLVVIFYYSLQREKHKYLYDSKFQRQRQINSSEEEQLLCAEMIKRSPPDPQNSGKFNC